MSIFFCVVCQKNHDSDEVEMYEYKGETYEYTSCYEGDKNRVMEAKG